MENEEEHNQPEEIAEEPVETAEEVETTEKKPASKVTAVKKTKPKKDPGRVAAGKRLVEFNRKT